MIKDIVSNIQQNKHNSKFDLYNTIDYMIVYYEPFNGSSNSFQENFFSLFEICSVDNEFWGNAV